MDKIILFPSIIVGSIFIGIYLFRCYKGHTEYNLSVMVTLLLSSSGIVGGILLTTCIFFEKIKMLDGINLYIVIAGISVISVSIQGIYRDVFKKKENET